MLSDEPAAADEESKDLRLQLLSSIHKRRVPHISMLRCGKARTSTGGFL